MAIINVITLLGGFFGGFFENHAGTLKMLNKKKACL